jgi:hypothetical protein
MGYELLERAAGGALPLVVADPSEVDVLRTYVAAGLVRAEIPEATRLARGGHDQQPARLLALTAEGRKVVDSMRGGTAVFRRLKVRLLAP